MGPWIVESEVQWFVRSRTPMFKREQTSNAATMPRWILQHCRVCNLQGPVCGRIFLSCRLCQPYSTRMWGSPCLLPRGVFRATTSAFRFLCNWWHFFHTHFESKMQVLSDRWNVWLHSTVPKYHTII